MSLLHHLEAGIDVLLAAAVHAGIHHQRVEAVGVVDRRDDQQLLELGILEVVPRGWSGPALLLEGLGVDHEAGAGLADRDRLVVLEQGGGIELALVEALDRRAEAELDRLVHRTVVDDGDVDHLVGLLRLQLGQRIGRVAGDILDLDAVLLLEGREHFLAQMLVPDAAIARHGERLGLRQRRSGDQGEKRGGDD